GVHSARIPGADLWLEVISCASKQKRILNVALIGGLPGVAEQVKSKLMTPPFNVNIVLVKDGYREVKDADLLADLLIKTRPNFVLVAMGSPRQEVLISALRSKYDKAYYLGLGGSFDVFTGRVKRAPLWMQNSGLEWLHRLFVDPWRIFRQLKFIKFVYLLVLGKLGAGSSSKCNS
ncbi:MAG: WecB/TagA/CpsF family glycosyltransferase, partial [Candidatus Saccharimonadales bacterium]